MQMTEKKKKKKKKLFRRGPLKYDSDYPPEIGSGGIRECWGKKRASKD